MIFSILICTYNGQARLPDTLRFLAQLTYPQLNKVEVLVIDNASTDQTRQIAISTWNELGSPFSLQVYYMPEPGKTRALELGVQKAQGRFILICDDDNWLAPDYLQVADSFFGLHPQVGILGGFITPVANVPFPEWFQQYAWAYACGAQWRQEGITTGVRPLWGAGMVIRYSLIRHIFSAENPLQLSCRKGEELISGGDDEICYRGWLAGSDSYYLPALTLQHYLPAHRLTEEYRNKLLEGFRHQQPVIESYYSIFYLKQYRGNKIYFGIKKALSLAWIAISGTIHQQRHARNHLYFLTGLRLFETPENRQVRSFYRGLQQHLPVEAI